MSQYYQTYEQPANTFGSRSSTAVPNEYQNTVGESRRVYMKPGRGRVQHGDPRSSMDSTFTQQDNPLYEVVRDGTDIQSSNSVVTAKATDHRLMILIFILIVLCFGAAFTAIVLSVTSLSNTGDNRPDPTSRLENVVMQMQSELQALHNLTWKLNIALDEEVEKRAAQIRDIQTILNATSKVPENSNVNTEIRDLQTKTDLLQNAVDKVEKDLQSSNQTWTSSLVSLNSTFNALQVSGNGACSPHYYEYNPHSHTFYRIVEKHLKWEEAKAHCEDAGEYLATFFDRASLNWFADKRTKNLDWIKSKGRELWLGGRPDKGKWKWNGYITADIDSSLWDRNKPESNSNAFCTDLNKQTYMQDFNCAFAQSFVCETG